MSLEEFVMITDQLPDLEWAVLHGIGEPLLDKALPEIILHLKRRGVYVLINSNGILLDEIKQQQIMNAGLDELRISLDAASKHGHQGIRNSDAFDRILSNLQVFTETLALYQADRPKISLWFLGTRENITELPDLIEIASDTGISEVYLQRLVYFQDNDGYGVARKDQTLRHGDKNTMQVIEKSQDLAARLGIHFKASGDGAPVESLIGKADNQIPWQKYYRPEPLTYITANGSVLPCCVSLFATVDYA